MLGRPDEADPLLQQAAGLQRGDEPIADPSGGHEYGCVATPNRRVDGHLRARERGGYE